MSLKETYIQYGLPSSWAHEYELIGISASTFKTTSKKNLIDKYKIPEKQIKFVKNCLVRQPIDDSIVQNLLENNGFVCCLCKGIQCDAYVIHHIVEYSLTKDNKYSNLAVVCPNHHDLAHRTGVMLTNQITEKQIREAKKSWEDQVKKEKKSAALNKPIRGTIRGWQKEALYKELQSFTESDKEFFFGRNTEIRELLIKIHKYSIVGLFGESGTGKTSLINAGLIPNFKKEGFLTVSVRCLDEPIKRIREELLKTFKEKKVSTPLIEELAATDTFPRLIIKLKSIVEKENLNLIIIIDQFEELFTRAREEERENLSKGISESLILNSIKGKVYFLLSLREDYIGELWDWAHLYTLEDAWVQQYRINRLTDEKAFEAIVKPLHGRGIKADTKFVWQLISELKNIGDGLIYPPYLQIVCAGLFEEYKIQNSSSNPLIEFSQNLYKGTNNAETIIADYLSESMLRDLTEEEKVNAQNILDLLTGSEGLRAFLTIEDICRHLTLTSSNAHHVIEHLIKKKIVHPIVGDDKVIGYELVHDFLSRKFFDKLGTEAKREKTTIDIFRKSFREWKQHKVLASKDRLEILFPNIKQLILNDEEWAFLIKSSFTVYWYFDNKWTHQIEKEKLSIICKNLLQDNNEEIIGNSITLLAEIEGTKITQTLIGIIESSETSDSIKSKAIDQFIFKIHDVRVLDTLKNIIKANKNSKLRKSAIYAFASHLSKLPKSDKNIIDKEIEIILDALNDAKTEVRKQAADIFSYTLVNEKTVDPLILRLGKETSISSRKAIIVALSSLLLRNFSAKKILPVLEKISTDEGEDYRVREEAKRGLLNGYK